MRLVAAAVIALVLVSGCSSGDGRSLPPAVEPLPATTTMVPSALPGAALRLVSPWGSDGLAPARTGCGTDAAAPAISWSGIPDGTSELAVVFSIDGIAQDVLVGVGPSTAGLTEGALPTGAFWWPPSAVGARWPGWCTDDDRDAELQITLYALNQQLEAADDTSVTDLVGMIALTAIGQATVIGRLDVPPPT